MYLLPLVLFLVLAGYFAVSLRPGHDIHELPSAMIEKPAPAFDSPACGDDQTAGAGRPEGAPVRHQFLRLLVRAVPDRAPAADAPGARRITCRSTASPTRTSRTTRHLLATFGDPYRQVGMDRDGRVGLDFGVYGVPETYVVDSSGVIRRRFVGPLTAETVEKDLLPLLKQLWTGQS